MENDNKAGPRPGQGEKRFEDGLATRRKVLGEDYVTSALDRATDFGWPMQKLVTEICWNDIWNRPGLNHRDRSMINLAMIAILNRPNELRAHVRGALGNGLSREEIAEVLLQAAVYGGVPVGVDGFRIAQSLFDELDKQGDEQ